MDKKVLRHYSDAGLIEEEVTGEEEERALMDYFDMKAAQYRQKAKEEEDRYFQEWDYATNSEEEDRRLADKFPVFCGPGNVLPGNYRWKDRRLMRKKLFDSVQTQALIDEKEKSGWYFDGETGYFEPGRIT